MDPIKKDARTIRIHYDRLLLEKLQLQDRQRNIITDLVRVTNGMKAIKSEYQDPRFDTTYRLTEDMRQVQRELNDQLANVENAIKERTHEMVRLDGIRLNIYKTNNHA